MSDPSFGRSAREFLRARGIAGSKELLNKPTLGESPAFTLQTESKEESPLDRGDEVLSQEGGGSIREIFSRDPLYRAAKERAHTYLGLQVKPSGAVRQKLLGLNFPAPVVEEVIQSLTEQGFLNDEALIRRAIASRTRGKKAEGRIVLAQRLRQQGFPAELIKRALSEYLPSADVLVETYFRDKYKKLWRQLYLKTQAEDLLPTCSALRSDPDLIRAIRAGCRRGFSPAQCYRAIDQILSEQDLL